jgi:hypothetical protein
MSGRHVIFALALLSTFCVLAILFFPLASGHGPYPVTHGPVTALRTLWAAALLRLSIVLAAACRFTIPAGAAYFQALFAANLLDYLSNSSPRLRAPSILRC